MTPDALVRYLIGVGLLPPETVVSDNLILEDVSRRNLNFKLRTKRGPSYFIKLGAPPQRAELVRQEALAFRTLHQRLPTARTASLALPRLHHHDADLGVLVAELIVGESLTERLRAFQFPPPPAHTAIGLALAELHSLPRPAANLPDRLNCSAPSVLSIHRPQPKMLATVSKANLELLRIIQGDPQMCAALDSLCVAWSTSAIVHNDLRWDNVLLADTGAEQSPWKVTIVDWELVGLGDPSWDVGCFLAGYLEGWLASMPIAAGLDAAESAQLASLSLTETHSAIRHFWDAYLSGFSGRHLHQDVLLQAVRYAAARLVQWAFEHLQSSPGLTGDAVAALQLSANILRKPGGAMGSLLGLDQPGVEK